MHDLLTYHIPEAVRIHVHAIDENGQSLLDKDGRSFTLNEFSVDPQITNFTVLESIIVKAFNLNCDFMITYLNRSLNKYVQLKSDWDIETAYLGNAKPYLDIRVQTTVPSNLATDWDIITTSDLNRVASYAGKQTSQLANNFFSKMEKIVSKAFNNKHQFEEELDENYNPIVNSLVEQSTTHSTDKQSTAFSKFSLLSKFKRRSTLSNETNQQLNQQTNHQIIQELSKSITTSSPNPQQSLNQDCIRSTLNRNSSNASTCSSQRQTAKKGLKSGNSVNKVKRISSVQDNQILHKILGKKNTSRTNLHEPLNEQQYMKYLHPDGRIKCLRELRLAIYRRGIDPPLRPTLYKHLLNVYPPNMTSEQRVRFVQQKADQYYQLCFTWQRNFSHQKVQQIHNQVRKDVLRTDRSHPFYVSKCNMDTEQQNDITSSVSTYSSILTQYDMQTRESSINSNYSTNCDYSTDAGIDQQVNGVYENRNVQALTNILTTYALNHKIGYWQGFSDLCSPLLLAIQNEAETYICFASLMRRLSANFSGEGECMTNKFDLLRKLLQHYDPEFFDYLEQQQAGDLLFCYRWLLLELKREFKLDHALYMLEVSWAAMPPQFYTDLSMYNKKFVPTEEEETVTKELKDSQEHNQDSTNVYKSSPRLVKKPITKSSTEIDAESVNSSKTLQNSVSNSKSMGSKLKENNNIKNLKHEMSKQLSNGVNQIRKSVNEVANVASEFYANLNNNQQQQQTDSDRSPSIQSTVRSTLKGLKLSSVEEQLACKREKFHQQNAGHSVNSLNDMRFSLDRDTESNQRKSKNSSLNGSNHSLIEYNNTLNYILTKTQAMLKQQEQKLKFNNFSFNLNGRKQSASSLSLFTNSNKDSNCKDKARSTNHRHIRFLPKILSTDSNDNTIDSPDADDLNEKCGGNFPHLINKQFSIDSVDSLDFNFTSNNNNINNNDSFFKGFSASSVSSNKQSSSFNNNFTCFTNLNNGNLPFTKQNSIPSQTSTLLKQQLKQSFNQQQSQFHYLKQRSLPSSPLFKKKLDSFERPFLPFFQNVSNLLDRNMFVNEQVSTTPANQSSAARSSTQISSKRSKLITNQFDSFDQRDLFVHCNGESEPATNNYYNTNWKPERGLLNCFDSMASFDASSQPQQQQTVQSTSSQHQRLARQLSDKLINEKMMHNHSTAARQSSYEERDGKRLIAHTQSATYTHPHQHLTSTLTKLNQSQSRNATVPQSSVTIANTSKTVKSNSTNSSTTYEISHEKEERSEGYCSGSISDRNSNCGEQSMTASNLGLTNAFSNSTTSLKSASSTSSSSTSISSLSCSSSMVILSSNTSFRSKIAQIEKQPPTLPSPRELSELSTGNAFMLFIGLTILLLHRDKLMKENLDANDIAIYFNSHVRKHDVHLVLNIARELFQLYLNKYQGYQLAEMADQSMLDNM